jgi:hypothetical protein
VTEPAARDGETPGPLQSADAARLAFEKLYTDLQFEITNLPAQRRLRGAQPLLGRPDEATLLSDRNEVTEMTKLHPVT